MEIKYNYGPFTKTFDSIKIENGDVDQIINQIMDFINSHLENHCYLGYDDENKILYKLIAGKFCPMPNYFTSDDPSWPEIYEKIKTLVKNN